MNRHLTLAILAAGVLTTTAAFSAADDDQDSGRSYGYFTALEDSATLVGSDGERAEAEVNLPILPGDTLHLGRGRAELFLPDATVLRVEAGSSLRFVQIAWSAGVEDTETVLEIERGEALLSLEREAAATSVRLPQGVVYLDPAGRYRVIADGTRSRVLVRDGRAELNTSRGSTIVLAEEEAIVSGTRTPRVAIAAAPPRDDLERWASLRDDENRWDDGGRVDSRLRYAAAPLERYGTWVEVDGINAWRPVHVAADWSPYVHGRWYRTTVGLTWVSADPWGWVPYSYGAWDWVDHWGWVWYPGRRWAPAHVTWYWGPRYAGWCPTGWYQRYRRHHWGPSIDINIHFGVYGWAGGRTRDWDRWRFVDYDHLGDRRLARNTRSARALADFGVTDLERGLLTTDTRPVVRARQIDADNVRNAWDRELRSTGRRPEQLPDVTAIAVRPRTLDPATRGALEKPIRIDGDPTLAPTRGAVRTRQVDPASKPARVGTVGDGNPAPAVGVGSRSPESAGARPRSRVGSDATPATRSTPSPTVDTERAPRVRPRAQPDDERQPAAGPGSPALRRSTARPETPAPTASSENRGLGSAERRVRIRTEANPSVTPRSRPEVAPREGAGVSPRSRPEVSPRSGAEAAPRSSTEPRVEREPPVRRVIESRRSAPTSDRRYEPRATAPRSRSAAPPTASFPSTAPRSRATAPTPSVRSPRREAAPPSSSSPPPPRREPAARSNDEGGGSRASSSSSGSGRSRAGARSRGSRDDG
jgi:hypothetical protein